MAWVLLRHPETGGAHLVPEGTVEPFEARGWVRSDMPAGLDPDDPYAPALLADVLNPPPGSAAAKQQKVAEAAAEDEAAKLKGQALADALEKRGLPNTGTADDKRAAVADYDAANPEPTDDAESGTEQESE
jgi:hypothetical protein